MKRILAVMIVWGMGLPKAMADFPNFPISTEGAAQTTPDISGNIVVWQDERNGNWDIYGKDLATSNEFAISTESRGQTMPAISGNIVVWQDGRNMSYSGVYGKNLSAGGEIRFSAPGFGGNQYAPAVSGDLVLWEQKWSNAGYGHRDIEGRYVSTWEWVLISTRDYKAPPPRHGEGGNK